MISIPILLALGVFAMALPFGFLLAFMASLGAFVLICAGLIFKSPVIRVTEEFLWVGSARIRRNSLGSIHVIGLENKMTELGPGLDARAYVCIQGSTTELLKVELLDASDPTPYWIFSTRRANLLADLLRR